METDHTVILSIIDNLPPILGAAAAAVATIYVVVRGNAKTLASSEKILEKSIAIETATNGTLHRQEALKEELINEVASLKVLLNIKDEQIVDKDKQLAVKNKE